MEFGSASSTFVTAPPPRLVGVTDDVAKTVVQPANGAESSSAGDRGLERRDTFTPSGRRPALEVEPTQAPEEADDPTAPRGKNGQPLSEAEQDQVEQLEARDREVRAHEMAHKNAAGQYATSGPTYTYQTGPDGQRYAVGGSVGIDLSPEETPEQTIEKMAVVRRAALAPAEPSSQDRKVAAQAAQIAMEARQEKLREEQAEAEDVKTDASGAAQSVDEAGSATASDGSTAGRTGDAASPTPSPKRAGFLERRPLDLYA